MSFSNICDYAWIKIRSIFNSIWRLHSFGWVDNNYKVIIFHYNFTNSLWFPRFICLLVSQRWSLSILFLRALMCILIRVLTSYQGVPIQRAWRFRGPSVRCWRHGHTGRVCHGSDIRDTHGCGRWWPWWRHKNADTPRLDNGCDNGCGNRCGGRS